MEAAVLPALLLLLALFFSSSSSSCSATGGGGGHPDGADGIDRWCTLTPHPKACAYYLSLPPRPPAPKDRLGFFRLSVHAALKRAVRARRRLMSLKRRCKKQYPARHAWSDCANLYENAVLQLNRTLRRPRTKSRGGGDDAQTWLSAALTDLDMCWKSFAELRAPLSLIRPLAKYNASELISNSLAVNKPLANATAAPTTAAPGGFPSWTSNKVRRRLLQASSGVTSVKANLVVAKDGSGDFRTLKDAINAASKMTRKGKFVIHVKAGVYNENVQIPSSMADITLVGDGKGKSIITGRNSVAAGFTLITSATLSVFGDRFIARDMTFRNTYGPGSQALALLVASDQSVVYRCSIEGYQDTLFAFSQRQFYRECDIFGTIDFIFGNAAAVFQSCNIYLRRPRKGESNVITAQGRSDPNQNTGIVIQFSDIRASAELWPARRTVKSYLGRPWMKYSRTVYMQNNIGSAVDLAGWLPWNGDFALGTLYYAEFRNKGPGARMSGRVRWPGHHVIVKPSLVRKFTVGNFIAGGVWLPSTGVPFASGL